MKSIVEIIQKDLKMQLDGAVIKAVQEVGINVDKERLERALYDARAFYEEGYRDGMASVKHGTWIPTTKHDWIKDENGKIDEFAFESGYHNGVVCEICECCMCVHCHPEYDEDDECADHFVCSECGRHELKQYPYCRCGAKMDGGKEE